MDTIRPCSRAGAASCTGAAAGSPRSRSSSPAASRRWPTAPPTTSRPAAGSTRRPSRPRSPSAWRPSTAADDRRSSRCSGRPSPAPTRAPTAFQDAIATTLAPVLDLEGVTGLTGYAETGDDRFISEAGDAAYVLIGLDVDEDSSIELVDPVEAALATPAGYSVALTGFGPIQQDSARLSEQDLIRAETVSLPIAALVLILVFGSLIAAGMPLLVAGLAIPTSVGIINLVAQQTRDEHLRPEHRDDARARARDRLLPVHHQPIPRGAGPRADASSRRSSAPSGTAGKAVLFSGIAVAIGLSGLLWFQASAPDLDRARRRDRRPRVGGLQPDVPAGDPGHARAAGELAVRRRTPAARRLAARSARHASERRAGRRSPTPSCAGRSPCSCRCSRSCCSSARRTCASSRASRTRRSIPPGVPSRDAWVALQDGVPSGRDDADHHPARHLRRAPPSEATIAAVAALADRLTALEGVDRVEGPFTIDDPATGAPMTAGAGRAAVRRAARARSRPSSRPASRSSGRPTSAARPSGSTRSARSTPPTPPRPR